MEKLLHLRHLCLGRSVYPDGVLIRVRSELLVLRVQIAEALVEELMLRAAF